MRCKTCDDKNRNEGDKWISRIQGIAAHLDKITNNDEIAKKNV